MKTSLHFKKKLLASLITASVAAIAIAPTVSWAQTANATLRGRAPAGAVITAREIATGAVRRTKADSDGSYALVGLSPGTYKIDAGPGTEHTVTLSVASTANLDLTAAPSPTNATTLGGITVNATTLVGVNTSQVGNVVSLHQINTTPQLTRNFLEFADTVPGMVFVNNGGKTSIQSGAQPSSNINVYIDGVGQKNYVHGGGLSGQAGPNHDGDFGNPFPQLAIGQYRVITSNYKAEYDQISSAAITADTKSGTNQFHGEAFSNFTGDRFRAATPAENAAHKKARSISREYGFALGGPIIQDKMHFFVTYEGKSFDTPTTTIPPGNTYNGQSYATFLPPSAAAQFGPSTLPFKEDLYFGKIDWEPSDRDRVELSSKVRRETQISGAGGQIAPSANYNYRNNDTRLDGRWQHSTDLWTNELLLTYENTLDSPSAITNSPATTYQWQPTNSTILLINGQDPRQYFEASQKGSGFQDDLTFNDLNWHGDHVIKMGVKYKNITLLDRDSATSANYFYNVSPTGTEATPYQVVFGKVNSGLPLAAVSHNKQFGTYIQDDWAINDKLTLNLGVRWDYEESPEFLNYKTLAPIVSAINAPSYIYGGQTIPQSYAQSLALGGININNYISTGSNRKAPKNEFQPRLGFSYDLDGDGNHVIFGGAGRAFDRNLFDVISLENSKNALSEPSIYFENAYGTGGCGVGQADGKQCFVWDPKYLNAANLQNLGNGVGEVDMFNNNLKAPYSDQFSIGMRNKLGDWNTSATISRINQYNGIIGTLGNRYPNGHYYTYGSNTNQWGGAGVPGIGGLILWDNGKETRNTELLISAEKPYTRESHWGMTVAYTFTHATQNRLYSDQYAFDLPGIQYYPFLTSSAAAKHRLVVTGVVDIPWGVTLAGKLTLATPTPVADIACCNLIPNSVGVNHEMSAAYPVVGSPRGAHFLLGGPIFGYRSVDLQATKNIALSHGMTFSLRLDVINLFNFNNYNSTINSWSSSTGQLQRNVVYNPIGGIYGVPRTVKLTADFKF
jgi:outer membrane receptor protein involved in Fe transport